MPALRTYTIQFDTPLFPNQIKAFRQSVIGIAEKYGEILKSNNLPLDLFTNEYIDAAGKKKTIERYPLVQYKVIDKHAAVTGLQNGADALKLVWQAWKKNEKGQTLFGLSQANSQAEENECVCKMITGHKMYRMYHWLALNKANETIYQSKKKLTEKVKFLEERLVQHIEKLATDNDWKLPKKVKVFLGEITHIEQNKFKHRHYRAFNCTFGANILLPQQIGLGNSPAFGFGKILYLPEGKMLKEEMLETVALDELFDILEK